MLFYGPPGTGKTSTILALARQLFGYASITIVFVCKVLTVIRPDNFRTRVLELNASDERGISIVREKIKNFARQTPRAETVASDGKKYPCPPYKIIILDEADSMTQDAQAALRRIMENYARITRFCLVCNYVTRFACLSKYMFLVQHERTGSSNHLHLDAQSFVSSLSTLLQLENVLDTLRPSNKFLWMTLSSLPSFLLPLVTCDAPSRIYSQQHVSHARRIHRRLFSPRTSKR